LGIRLGGKCKETFPLAVLEIIFLKSLMLIYQEHMIVSAFKMLGFFLTGIIFSTFLIMLVLNF